MNRWGCVGVFLALCAGLAPRAFGEVTTVSYRESAASFSWELRWDGVGPSSPAEVAPPREPGDTPDLWRPVVKLSGVRGDTRALRCVFQVRHTSRVHETDLPEGAIYTAAFVVTARGAARREWVRLDRRPVPHLASPKDALDTLDVCLRSDVGPDGSRVERLLFQGVHGTAPKAKKPKKPKLSGEGKRRP